MIRLIRRTTITAALAALLVAGALLVGRTLYAPQVAFQSGPRFSEDIYLMDIRARLPLPLTHGPGRDVWLGWKPDGDSLSFGSNRVRRSNLDMYTVRIDNREVERITAIMQEAFNPVWSHDGERLVFLGGVGTYTDVFIQEGEQRRKITRRGIASQPVWSPDGQQIAFIDAHQNNPDLYVIGVDESNPRRLTRDMGASSPVWLPDGTGIAFTARREGGRSLYAIDADGENLRPLLDNTHVWGVTWSPDPAQFAYIAGDGPSRDLYTARVRPDGTLDTRRITHGMIVETVDWHGSKGWLVFSGRRDQMALADLYAARTSWERPRRLTRNSFADLYPQWRPEPAR